MLNAMKISLRSHIESTHVAEFIVRQKILQDLSFIELDMAKTEEDSVVLFKGHPEDEASTGVHPRNS